MTTPRISLTTTPLDHSTTAVALAGELDLYTVAYIEAELTHLTRETERELLLDLADVTFRDSSGVALFLRVHRRVRGGRCALEPVPHPAAYCSRHPRPGCAPRRALLLRLTNRGDPACGEGGTGTAERSVRPY
ncbi:STAS domain-containing protein [Streptomyces sp. NPDC058434]|uniref:STAS domain-containing protein n=1 Tax=Streptomyces sp. NPDC058434 TaxID=3346498 RepID=UPI0036601836